MANQGKACRRRELLKDPISELPDDVLVYIHSLLTMKESGRTSVLSKRWRYVWACIPALNFDASNTIHKLMLRDGLLEVERHRYLSWVNQVVGSYKRPTIDEFRVRFGLNMASSPSIDNWVQFVMEKRVKRLQLDFSPSRGAAKDISYTLRGSSVCNLLTSLQLDSVDVTGEVLENFLISCPKLEYLLVKSSKSLVNLEVARETPNLKYLEISLCFEIKHIEICAPNLESFEYFGPEVNISFGRTPNLAKLSIGGMFGRYLTNKFSGFSSHLCQLEALTLHIRIGVKAIYQFPLCTRFKHLKLKISCFDEDLFCFTEIVKACPILHKFVLEIEWLKPGVKRKRLNIDVVPHCHLKIVEVVGFVGNGNELEFIMYLMESCVVLEKIVIDPRDPSLRGTPWEFELDKSKIRARKLAKKLRAKLNSSVDLIIL